MENGGDIALAGMTIVGVIQMLILMPIFGINQGTQPLLGYNYGAKKFDRVLRTYLLAVAAGTVVFAAAMLFSTQLVKMFVSEADPTLMYFAPRRSSQARSCGGVGNACRNGHPPHETIFVGDSEIDKPDELWELLGRK